MNIALKIPDAEITSEKNRAHLDAAVDGMTCVSCARRIERMLAASLGVSAAQVNLTNRRLSVDYDPGAIDGPSLLAKVNELGFRATPLSEGLSESAKRESRALIRALGVAGFAAGNVMVYSVAVWAGLAQDMGPVTRAVMQWIAAAIALPAVAYAGQPFFQGAWRALSHWRINMDVPIALALILTCISSVIELLRGAPHVYFDGAATLTFILLIGRVMDFNARARARMGAEALAALQVLTATRIDADGTLVNVPSRSLIAGQLVKVRAGERVPADGIVEDGRSDVDMSLVSGESVPESISAGARIFAGTLNLTGPLNIRVNAAGPDTLLAEIGRLMDNAAQGRSTFVTFADKAISIYAPMVHILAAATFFGWLWLGDVVWQQALINAVTVLIITCPCALGLAVPITHVVAAGRLFAAGVLLKSGDALERLASVDWVVMDKTGTLTQSHPALVGDAAAPNHLALTLALARESNHPLARALAATYAGQMQITLSDITEHPGQGMSGHDGARIIRLGNRKFVGVDDVANDGLAEIWLDPGGGQPVRFAFETPLRTDAAQCIQALKKDGLGVEILSGDRQVAVLPVGAQLGIPATAEANPSDKLKWLNRLRDQGHHVLMVGDGLNDAPALAAAHVSMAPASAADISQSAADVVFRGDMLMPVARTLHIARFCESVVRQNIYISLAYNIVAVPLAIMGQVTPLIAAVAMSVSSLTVVLNALRLKRA